MLFSIWSCLGTSRVTLLLFFFCFFSVLLSFNNIPLVGWNQALVWKPCTSSRRIMVVCGNFSRFDLHSGSTIRKRRGQLPVACPTPTPRKTWDAYDINVTSDVVLLLAEMICRNWYNHERIIWLSLIFVLFFLLVRAYNMQFSGSTPCTSRWIMGPSKTYLIRKHD